MGQGLSIANNLLANNVSLNLNRNQNSLKNLTNQLSSGLRINSAADDPSGLAIATHLQTQVDGFHEAAQNVQNATNAAQIAEGALQTTTDILQRIRNLAVEAASDVNSTNDRANLQTEVSQLLLEVNRISQNTNFNGQHLLDGSHAGFQAAQAAFTNVTANTVLASNGGNAALADLAASVTVGTSGSGFVTTGNGVASGITVGGTAGNGLTDGTIELQVVNNGASVGVQATFIESGSGTVSVSSTLYGSISNNVVNVFDNISVSLGAFSTADVGTTAFIKVSQNVPALTNPTNPAFNIQSAADEGDVVQIGIQATNTQTLRISNINVALGSANSPSLGAEDAIGQIDNALQGLLTQRAQLGAVQVRLQEDQDSANVAAVNLQAAESNIRDLNVGQATTEFTKLQILVQVGTSVLAQSNSNAQTVLGLFR